MYLLKKLAQVATWLLLGAIVVLSLVPPDLRPVTGTPHVFEHAGIFLITGVAFSIGYRISTGSSWALAIAFSAAIELMQTLVPGRHAPVSDFVVDATAACVGLVLGMATVRAIERKA